MDHLTILEPDIVEAHTLSERSLEVLSLMCGSSVYCSVSLLSLEENLLSMAILMPVHYTLAQ